MNTGETVHCEAHCHDKSFIMNLYIWYVFTGKMCKCVYIDDFACTAPNIIKVFRIILSSSGQSKIQRNGTNGKKNSDAIR